MGIDLSIIWAVIIFFGVFMYIVMDGFDLGIGILFPFVPDRHERDVMMNTVAPVWDGNETWLVLGGAALLAAFPLAYSVILTALYLPLIFMLLGLIFRGVAFEFRFKARDHERHVWDKAFIGGSLTAAFFQGVALGAYIDGFPMQGHVYVGHVLDWLRPFPLLCGVGVIVAYGLLGSTWLIMKTEGDLQRRMLQLTRPLLALVVAAIGAVSVWTPFVNPRVTARWFSFPNMLWFAPVPVLLAIGVILLLRFIRTNSQHHGAFAAALAIVFLGYTGLAISIFPNIIPPSISIWEAASSPQSQGFALVGTLFIIPFILGYTVWSYYVFRGKVKLGDGYH
ncbi:MULTISPECIES: cytochrome d ubiquinol oxidase subunit II [unclassified Undibacterium]|uniref:cytochrome d ubiquinol oxidase subunit II n=1 Tax=unclassified Undibacterium TaxID=2630295 RepID=UPI002AC8A595|nr:MULTISPECIES: cytochrome d ubiquinol oxidase subunit II [unclassified Undibacterium]MEB0137608.1 cytochrome d ubiquinol oxidase subunit II [Undibacterium sp. CCC2.1]MEB0170609.1 cytochrome d ubiquinol oxidase subunit II [Undibacterium sp. CCC1.1]MEB0174550.1 cytochrome d ubiquinol oxidase subunit II [Undibacterium sp. CCC3.4]MEB0213653.1 cytochrome d ubiquinol oxidase subunit II [Undibacterium sp. 5I2]WPX43819.1 cytochrome d ubiquinol oxidase subunit II [Undibacterium sp. CCC3.4]